MNFPREGNFWKNFVSLQPENKVVVPKCIKFSSENEVVIFDKVPYSLIINVNFYNFENIKCWFIFQDSNSMIKKEGNLADIIFFGYIFKYIQKYFLLE